MDEGQLVLIPLCRPNISTADIEAVTEVLRSGMLVQGSKVAQLESAFCDYLGVKHAVAVSSGTATLHLALVALGIGAGDEVIIPALSYVATANVVELVGATPVFVDVKTEDFNIDTSKIEEAISERTKVIMPVHEFGLCSEMDKICEIARRHKLQVIEDAACALGATQNGNFAGTMGRVGSFSLHPRKAVTSGEGGVLTTDDDKLAHSFRVLRNHGIETRDGKMEFISAGFNYRMTDFQAALVLGQLGRFEANLSNRQEQANFYRSALVDHPAYVTPMEFPDRRHTWQTFHLLVNNELDRNGVMNELRAQGVGSSYGAQCIPAVEFYQQKYALDSAKLFPNALRAFKSGLAIPLFDGLSKEENQLVLRGLEAVAAQLRQRTSLI